MLRLLAHSAAAVALKSRTLAVRSLESPKNAEIYRITVFHQLFLHVGFPLVLLVRLSHSVAGNQGAKTKEEIPTFF